MDILLVEDDFDVARNLCDYFEADGHEVEWAPDALIGLASATARPRDVIVLDIALPHLSGIELCRRLRAAGMTGVPIIMLTAHSELEDKLTAFDCGADDYLVKPFALEELERRLHALTRRARAGFDTVLRVADLEFDTATLVVRRARTIVSLPATGRRLLEALMRNTHRVLSRVELERCLWGDETPQSNALKTHVHALREAIDRPFGSPLIHTVRGAGYRLCAPPDAHD